MSKPRKKRKPLAHVVFICPHCTAATVVDQPIPKVPYGMVQLKGRRK